MMKNIYVLLVFVMITLGATAYVIGTPVGVADLGTPADSRGDHDNVVAIADEAYAGNITAIYPNVTTNTNSWQGYYGNVTAQIVLDNANNLSMYDWDVTSPSGVIMAVNETIADFSGIKCFNFTDPDDVNLTILSGEIINCTGNDDCVNETFTSEVHDTFTIGTLSFTNECNATKSNSDDGASTSYDQILLYEPTADLVIYAGLLHNDETAFDGGLADFQLLVGEDGHGNTDKTSYYFYLELS